MLATRLFLLASLLSIPPFAWAEAVCHGGGGFLPAGTTASVSTCSQSYQPEFPAHSMISDSISEMLCQGLSCTPTEARVLESFSASVSPEAYGSVSSVGTMNSGIVTQNGALLASNRCFLDLTTRFYLSQQEILKGLPSREDFASTSQGGRVWDYALKFAGGNKDLALAIIGVCGHDDIMNTPLSNFCVQPDELKELFGPKATCDPDTEPVSLQSPASPRLVCPMNPRTNGFYLPEGLPGVRMNASTRERLVKSYAPNVPYEKAASLLPEKYYHTYGGASLTCGLIESGVSKTKAMEAEKITALIYRSARVCQAAKTNINNFTKLLGTMEAAGVSKEPLDFTKIGDQKEAWNRESQKVVDFLLAHQSLAKSLGLVNGSLDSLDKDDRAALLNKIKVYPGIVLAGILTKNEAVGGTQNQIADRLKSSTNYGSDPSYFLKVWNAMNAKVNSPLVKMAGFGSLIPGLDKVAGLTDILPCMNNNLMAFATDHSYSCNGFKDCETAQAKMKTYEADFLQTARAHQQGAEFAMANCSPAGAQGKATSDAVSCPVLEKLKSNPPQWPSLQGGDSKPSVLSPLKQKADPAK